ncbi:hypothetical protein Tco_0629578 [Tanacetum coccineum]|uniref:DNA-directed primase/polymerase protein n=1 Tax=Tanacetum coccineum TaxID=301880 RepID=A0ABQ4WTI4_9ASTR
MLFSRICIEIDTDTDDDNEDVELENKLYEYDDEIENDVIVCDSKIDDFKGKDFYTSIVGKKKLNNANHLSSVVFYGSPKGVRPKRQSRLLRLLDEIRVELEDQHKSIEDIWATFLREDEAMNYAKDFLGTRIFSYQDHVSGQRRFLVSTYKEFWRRYKNMNCKFRHHYEVIQENREPLPEYILGVTTQRDTRRHYLKRYWEPLPKEILGAITQRDTAMWVSLHNDVTALIWVSLPKDMSSAQTTSRASSSWFLASKGFVLSSTSGKAWLGLIIELNKVEEDGEVRVMIRDFGDLVAKLDDKMVMEELVRCWSNGDVVPTSVPIIWLPFTNRNSDEPQNIMSSSNNHIIVPSNSDIEDAFSSINVPNYIPATPGNTSPDSSNDLTKYLLATLVFLPLHDDSYIEVMQAYDATNNELPIPPL